VIVIKLNKA